MKKIALFMASAFFAIAAGSAFADCDVRKADEDKQAMCAQKCDDDFIRNKENYNADLAKIKTDKKACDEKCGCPQNSKDL